MSEFDPSTLPELLKVYYKRLFPYKPHYKWLSYGKSPQESYARREFAFILKDDVYLRYRDYEQQLEFEKDVQANVPFKIDIGAVFNHRPRDRKKHERTFDAVERELVFDIDLTDYDDIRTCCSGGGICRKCWKLVVAAVRVLDAALREDFGFDHRLWVFSGRRGVHCWVADDEARVLDAQGRAAVADYLTVVKGGERLSKKVVLDGWQLHPAVERAVHLLLGDDGGLFLQLVVEQGWLDSAEQFGAVLKLIKNEEVRAAVHEKLAKLEQPAARCRALMTMFGVSSGDQRHSLVTDDAKWFFHEFILQYAYPRLDANVTKGFNHLLKSPFCVHPKTGFVAVPLDVRNVTDFDPTTAPRVDRVVGELSKTATVGTDENVGQRRLLEYKRTSLGPFVDTLEHFTNALLRSETQKAPCQDTQTNAQC